jgi:hypothetical protein
MKKFKLKPAPERVVVDSSTTGFGCARRPNSTVAFFATVRFGMNHSEQILGMVGPARAQPSPLGYHFVDCTEMVSSARHLHAVTLPKAESFPAYRLRWKPSRWAASRILRGETPSAQQWVPSGYAQRNLRSGKKRGKPSAKQAGEEVGG